jgi:methionine synthase II (cobalamin-independent)
MLIKKFNVIVGRGIGYMFNGFKPNCRSVLIGSLPVKAHREAISLVWQYNPEIPLWVQLPVNRAEGMIPQFLPGMPGLKTDSGTPYINTDDPAFDSELVDFYEEYLDITEDRKEIEDSRFALSRDTAEGFFVFCDDIQNQPKAPVAVKGQVTGPVTFATGLTDQDKRAVFYNEQVRDTAVKLLSLKAVWQVKQLLPLKVPVIIFIDEPALAGYGSSEFTSISKEQVTICLEEVIGAVHDAGGLAGIHVCANTDWSVILDTSVDIVNFDAYSFFDRFILYPELIKRFINSGGILAWGIIPTSNEEDIEKETAESLVAKWKKQVAEIEGLGIDRSRIWAQSLISPSCGTGSLSKAHAIKVLGLTRSVSEILRKEIK